MLTDQPVLLIHGNFCLNVSRARHVPSERISPIQPELGATSAPSDLTRQTLALHQRSCPLFHMNDTKFFAKFVLPFLLSSSFKPSIRNRKVLTKYDLRYDYFFFLQEDCCRMMIEGYALVYRPSAPLLTFVLCLVFLFCTSIG